MTTDLEEHLDCLAEKFAPSPEVLKSLPAGSRKYRAPIRTIGPPSLLLMDDHNMRATGAEPKLKLFDPENRVAQTPKMKRVRLKQIVRVLFDAVQTDRTWLSDFADDEVKISADLYEVLTLARRLRPSA